MMHRDPWLWQAVPLGQMMAISNSFATMVDRLGTNVVQAIHYYISLKHCLSGHFNGRALHRYER